MTCIAAVVEDGIVTMGGDSAGTSDDQTLSTVDCAEPKVWKIGPVVFGAFGSFRVAQVLRFQAAIPIFDEDRHDALEYVVTDLVDSMRSSLELAGSLSTWFEDSTVAMNGSGLLVGVGGRLFDIFGDFGVGEYRDGFAAVGCGAPYAYGSLYATVGQKPRKRVHGALKAAERFSAGVRGPFIIEKAS